MARRPKSNMEVLMGDGDAILRQNVRGRRLLVIGGDLMSLTSPSSRAVCVEPPHWFNSYSMQGQTKPL